MLISEFARATGLTRDTVRFYVRLGLLRPERNRTGGRNPYQIFTTGHVRTAKVIRVAQSLGMSLKEIATVNEERRRGRITHERSIEILKGQLAHLQERATELKHMMNYMQAKIDWLEKGERGPQPNFDDYAGTGTRKRTGRVLPIDGLGRRANSV